jgi:transposase
MDIRELLIHIRDNPHDRAVQRDTGADRRTVQRYRRWATHHGLLTDPLPPLADLHALLATTLVLPPPPQNVSSVEPYRTQVVALRQQGTEVAAIHQRLKERGYAGSYGSVYRFVRSLDPQHPTATVRVERAPGEEAQVDFGFAGRMIDPASGSLRKTWAFVMTLSWSRHQFVRFVFDQRVETWLQLHHQAFRFFGGVPRRLVIDNLKAGITKACWEDPQVQQAYRECAEHYGFRIAPCRPRTPEHKGKVESGVHYVQRNFLGGRTVTTITQANADVLPWCSTTAGERIHGTTRERPLDRFQQTEQAQLKALPATAYDLATWKVVKLHRDCYLTFDNAYYSAPFRLIGQQLRVRGGLTTVRIYTLDYQLVATHTRAQHPGQRQTHPDHLPPHKLPGLQVTREGCRATAAEIGVATSEVIATLLEDPVIDHVQTAGRLLQLRERFSAERLEAACARALRFAEPNYRTVERILEQRLDEQPVPAPVAPAPAQAFIRTAAELVGHLFGGVTWN